MLCQTASYKDPSLKSHKAKGLLDQAILTAHPVHDPLVSTLSCVFLCKLAAQDHLCPHFLFQEDETCLSFRQGVHGICLFLASCLWPPVQRLLLLPGPVLPSGLPFHLFFLYIFVSLKTWAVVLQFQHWPSRVTKGKQSFGSPPTVVLIQCRDPLVLSCSGLGP